MKPRILVPYLEQQILSASPLQLVTLSYQTAIRAVRNARTLLAQGEVSERVRAVCLAHGILAELYRSLDLKAGDGQISRELNRLYEYMMRRLLEANAKAQDEPLAEVLALLCPLAEAWEEIGSVDSRVAPTRQWALPEATAAGSGHYSLSC